MLSEQIREHIQERGWEFPTFKVLDKEGARKYFGELGWNTYAYDIGDESLLLVFQLPAPLARYWWKGKGDWGDAGEDFGGTVIGWGKLYRELMPVVWEKLGFEENEGTLDFHRVNQVGEHDPKEFYYIWEVSTR